MEDEDAAWIDYRTRFVDVYDESNYGAGLQGLVMNAGHKLAEAKFGPRFRFERVLEVGAGTGVHLPFVRHAYSEYRVTDIDQSAVAKAKERLESNEKVAVGVTFGTHGARELPYADGSWDRLVATHVLEHLYEPHRVLREWQRVVRPGGVITLLLPSDPGLAWRIGRMMGPRRHSERLGVAYDYVMAREHVNPLNNLLAFLRHYFVERTELWWPLRIPSMDANLFFVCHATVPLMAAR